MGTLEHILEHRAGGAVSPATLWPQRCQLNMSPPRPRPHFCCSSDAQVSFWLHCRALLRARRLSASQGGS